MVEKSFFIGGPITNINTCNKRGETLEELIKSCVSTIESKGHNVFSAHIIEDFGRNKLECDETITRRDLGWIESADSCIFVFPLDCDNVPIRTDGTYIELGYAISRNKDIIVFWDEMCKEEYSPMFRGLSYKKIKFMDISMMKKVIDAVE